MNKSGRFITGITLALASTSFALILAGCASPQGIAPTAQAIQANALLDTDAPSASVRDNWWQAYGDDRLNELVERGLAANPNLAAVSARIERAEAAIDAADAARKPRADASLDITRERYSATGPYPPGLAGEIKNSGSLLVTGRWEVDAFGRQRAVLDAALGAQRAAAADLESARILLATNIVRQYVHLARLVDERSVFDRTLMQRQELLGLVRQRVAAGLDTSVELRQSEGAIPEVRAVQEATSEQIATTRHALAALIGQRPDALDTLVPELSTVRVVPLPDAIPADLLGRRADVAAARWRVVAATNDFRAGRAAFYPSINLIAFAGFSSIGLDNLLQAGSREYGVGPAISLPIFDAGRLRANLKGKASDVDAAIDTYNSTVLEALRDTADALSSVRSVDIQRLEHAQALASAESAYELALQRYRAGLGTYLIVLTAETNVLAQRRASNDIKARALESQALLAHALGGGYLQSNGETSRRNAPVL